MKYLRLENSIICIKDEENILSSLGKRKRNYTIMGDVADTIEELCDCFVFIDEGCYPEVLYEDDLPIFPTKHMQFYGAIWTDKGLIYVAKMNDKGELELL